MWDTLWPQERRTQTAFHVFGMELLATLDLPSINAFFDTFFKLPRYAHMCCVTHTQTHTDTHTHTHTEAHEPDERMQM